ncbi:virulence factor [Escherichia coli]|nr:virulence factor [Escherichia coli]
MSALDKNMKADSIQYTELKDAHNFISLKYKECILNITALEDKIDKYSRLKNDYDNDIENSKRLKQQILALVYWIRKYFPVQSVIATH